MMMTRPWLLLLVTTLPLFAACGGPPQEQNATAPAATPTAESKRLVEPPHATLPDGTVIRLELAVTPEERARGLMFRPALKPDHGMIFLFEQAARWPFWMKDTWIPLDLVFLDGHGTVTQVFRNVPPCRAEPCPQYVPEKDAWAVLEVAAGTAEAHGVAPGVTLEFFRVPDYPLK